MWRRYLVPCVAVAAAAMGIAVVAYTGGSIAYIAACSFQVSEPPTSLGTNDSWGFQAEAALQQVLAVKSGDIFSGPASAVGTDPGTVAAGFTVLQTPNTATFTVSEADSEQQRSADIANRLCSEFVDRIGSNIAQAREAEVDHLRAQITALQESVNSAKAVPAKQATPGDLAFVDAQKRAIINDAGLLAATLALPPDNISVVTRSPTGIRTDTRSLGRDLLVGGIGALLASFLIILVGEMAREGRAPRAPRPTETTAAR